MPRSRTFLLLSIAISIVTFVFYLGLEAYMRPYASDGLYFQQWTSETMMQTLSIEDLRRAPFESLWYLHMQPPLFDALRGVLALLATAQGGPALVREVDQGLYLLWALGAALLGMVMFRWLKRLTSTTVALVATLLFMLHPGVIFYATLLDGTFLSAICIFLCYYELWKLSKNPHRSILPFTALFITLALLRTLFQWPAVIVFTAALILLKVPRRSVLTYVAICLVCLGSYLLKQYMIFGTTSTFGWRGLNVCRSIGNTDRYDMGSYHAAIHSAPEVTDRERALPAALSRRIKVSGTPNFNHESFIPFNREMVEFCDKRLKERTLRELIEAYRINMGIYFMPSSRYVTNNEIVDRIPWREGYDRLFSSPLLPGAISVALLITIVLIRRESFRSHVGLLLPGLFIFVLCVIGERGENMRLKIFLEPLFYVLIIASLYKALVLITGRRVGTP